MSTYAKAFLENLVPENAELCECCGNEIKVQIFKGSGHCCENCRKKLEGDTTTVDVTQRKKKP